MREIGIEVDQVPGRCTGAVPMPPATGFLVCNGSLLFPGGGPLCRYALPSLLPRLPAQERVVSAEDGAWMVQVDRVQCPDPRIALSGGSNGGRWLDAVDDPRGHRSRGRSRRTRRHRRSDRRAYVRVGSLYLP